MGHLQIPRVGACEEKIMKFLFLGRRGCRRGGEDEDEATSANHEASQFVCQMQCGHQFLK